MLLSDNQISLYLSHSPLFQQSTSLVNVLYDDNEPSRDSTVSFQVYISDHVSPRRLDLNLHISPAYHQSHPPLICSPDCWCEPRERHRSYRSLSYLGRIAGFMRNKLSRGDVSMSSA